MTSLSRRKRQITASEIRRKTKHNYRDARRWLFAGLFGTAAAVTSFVQSGIAQQRELPQNRRIAPPVHAAPTGNYRPQNQLRQPLKQAAAGTTGSFRVKQAAGFQQINDENKPQYLNQLPPTDSPATDPWQARSQQTQAPAGTFSNTAGASTTTSNAAYRSNQSPPWQDSGISDLAMPDTDIPATQQDSATPRFDTPPLRNSTTLEVENIEALAPPSNPSPVAMERDAAPVLDDFTPNTLSPESAEPQASVQRPAMQDTEQSVLIREESKPSEAPDLPQSNGLRDATAPAGSRRNLRGAEVPQRAPRQFQSIPNSRSTSARPVFTQEDELQRIAEVDQSRGRKSCEAYRTELLNAPITDIVLDISAIRPLAAAQRTPVGLDRTWTDCSGKELAKGKLVGLERSYIVIDDESGQGRLVPIAQLSEVDLFVVTQYWGLPIECNLGCDTFTPRNWKPNAFFWKASALCHKPLYFENRALERYGHTHGPVVEPLHSAAHFFVSLITLPYQTGINPPNECLYALGFYRPGDCAPWLREPIPLSLSGALNQTIAIVALGGIIP